MFYSMHLPRENRRATTKKRKERKRREAGASLQTETADNRSNIQPCGCSCKEQTLMVLWRSILECVEEKFL